MRRYMTNCLRCLGFIKNELVSHTPDMGLIDSHDPAIDDGFFYRELEWNLFLVMIFRITEH